VADQEADRGVAREAVAVEEVETTGEIPAAGCTTDAPDQARAKPINMATRICHSRLRQGGLVAVRRFGACANILTQVLR
jgi:hypothetical protein